MIRLTLSNRRWVGGTEAIAHSFAFMAVTFSNAVTGMSSSASASATATAAAAASATSATTTTIASSSSGAAAAAVSTAVAVVAAPPVFASLVACGAFFRLVTLPLSIYGDKCLARMATALPEVQSAYLSYKQIADHPRVVMWERKVAMQKLTNDRNRIFREYATNNVLMVAPHVAAMVACGYLSMWPAQLAASQLFSLSGSSIVGDGAAATATAAVTSWNPLADAVSNCLVSAGVDVAAGCLIDPTIAIASVITFVNCSNHLQRRRGFNDFMDAKVTTASLVLKCSLGAVAITSLVAPAFFPSFIGPMWMGMGIVGLFKVLVNQTAPLRFVFGIPDYPRQHGTYGPLLTSEAHPYRIEMQSKTIDPQEQLQQWNTSKTALEYECDMRIYKMFKTIGVFTEHEDFDHERERTRQKVEVVRRQREERYKHGAPSVSEQLKTPPLSAADDEIRNFAAPSGTSPLAAAPSTMDAAEQGKRFVTRNKGMAEMAEQQMIAESERRRARSRSDVPQ